jgi:L-2,4-diaminobutyrate decarboxylase
MPADPDGSTAPWRERLAVLRAAFPSPWRDAAEDRAFEHTFLDAVALIDQMKHPRMYAGQKAWQGYLGDPALPDYAGCRDVEMADASRPLASVIADLVGLFNGMPNWNHPQTMSNVIPPANTAAIVGATLCQIFSPNLVEGEYSWNVARAEIESAAMLAQLIGWDPHSSGGVFTYGGAGCHFYGAKLALTSVLGRDTRYTGIREDGQILVSRSAHAARQNSSDWTGLGMNNVREIEVDENNEMSVPHLREVMQQCRREGKPVVMVVCTMGTTDAFAVDPIAEVRAAIDGYENAKGYPKPFLYADAVIGWSWLAFGGYDFAANALGFSAEALRAIESNYRQIEPIHHADAIGVDFHKTGWTPYSSSLFMVRDYGRFTSLMDRPTPPYLQDRTDYNPYQFTLEVSRSGASAMSAWATLRLFGREGFRVMLGRIIEVKLYFRDLLDRSNGLVCVNPDNHGFVTLFRVYPRHVDAKAQYERELNDPAAREELLHYNTLQQRVANKLFAMLRDPAQREAGWENPPYVGFTSGFRPPNYAPDEHDGRYRMYALKAFPMSPNANELSMMVVRNYVAKARDLAVEELLAEDDEWVVDQAPPEPGQRTPGTWWGHNRSVPNRFLEAPADTRSRTRRWSTT